MRAYHLPLRIQARESPKSRPRLADDFEDKELCNSPGI